jgi:hypothetical protein
MLSFIKCYYPHNMLNKAYIIVSLLPWCLIINTHFNITAKLGKYLANRYSTLLAITKHSFNKVMLFLGLTRVYTYMTSEPMELSFLGVDAILWLQ